MDDETFKKLSYRAKYVACKYGFSEEADDIAQDVCTTFIANPDTSQTVEQAVIDYLRKYGGRLRQDKRPRIMLRNCVPLDEAKLGSEPSWGGGDFDRHLACLDKASRPIAVLRYVWGFSHPEIAHCFGITKARVSQILIQIHGRIERAMAQIKKRERD